MIATLQPSDITTGFGYSVQGQLKTVTDGLGHTTTYHLDDRGHVHRLDSPDTGTTLYQYDSAGNLIQKTDANGTVITYSYDAAGRLTKIGYPSDTKYGVDRLPTLRIN